MAAGIYKNGVAIIVTYQAVNSATGKTVTMDVYDEAHAKDVPKCVAAMTEVVATGRYYATFTPDAEGEWILIMKNTTDSNGEVVKAFAVAGHDMDSVGDAVAAIKAVTDVETGVKAAVNALNNISTAQVATELATYDAPTKAELDSGLALLATPAEVATELGTYDAPTKAELDAAHVTTDGLITIADTAIDGIQTDLSNATDGLGAIKTAVDAISSPAMVG